ncbi:MAG: Rpn family recombination-promoting nuclease/putative transposase, partial [Ruminococcus sp.]|nr:Rpn family recombination-promoting nuclease/putative transposase [Ruminococcus sp.]
KGLIKMNTQDRFANPKLDLVFKKIFGDANNSDLLISLLCAILKISPNSIKHIEIIDNEIVPDVLNKKFSRLDLLLQIENEYINIEIQVDNYGNYKERTLYYWSKVYSEQLGKGEDYNKLKDTIAINIIDFNLFDFKKSHSSFAIYESEEHIKLTNKLRIDFLELNKAKKYKTDIQLQEWLDFLNVSNEEELSMLEKTTTNPEIMKKAITVVRQMSADEKFLRDIQRRKETIINERSALNFAKNEGLTQGIEIGGKNKTIEIIKNMMANNIDIKTICLAINLTENEIEQLLEK